MAGFNTENQHAKRSRLVFNRSQRPAHGRPSAGNLDEPGPIKCQLVGLVIGILVEHHREVIAERPFDDVTPLDKNNTAKFGEFGPERGRPVQRSVRAGRRQRGASCECPALGVASRSCEQV